MPTEKSEKGLCIRCANATPRIAGYPLCGIPPERGWPCMGWVVWTGPRDEGVHECERFLPNDKWKSGT